MLGRLIALFVFVPLIELALLLKIGVRIGPLPTLLIVIVTGIAGAALARQQGWKTWMRIQSSLNSGRMPTEELIDGALILSGGVLLLTPGILTDALGISLLAPPSRAFHKRWLKKWLGRRVVRGGNGRDSGNGPIIDV